MSEDIKLKKLFTGPNNSKGSITIRTHTEAVLDLFFQQYSKFKSHFNFEAATGIRLFETLKMTLILHDIGKSIAVAIGEYYRQHEFTPPILISQMRRFGFAEIEIRLADALVGHDLIGLLVLDYINYDEAKAGMQIVADLAGLPLSQLLPL